MSRKSNPEGVSLLRGVYRPWYFMKRLQNLEGIGIERDLVGIPQIDVPAEMLDPDAPAAVKAALSYYKEMGQNIRNDEQACIIMPRVYDDSGHEMYGFKLVSAAGTRQFDIGASVERYKTDIATAVMADFMRLGHEGVGSYSLASSKTSLFATALGAWLDSICSVIQGRIPELLRFNGMDVKREPKLTHGDVEKIDLGQLGRVPDGAHGRAGGRAVQWPSRAAHPALSCWSKPGCPRRPRPRRSRPLMKSSSATSKRRRTRPHSLPCSTLHHQHHQTLRLPSRPRQQKATRSTV
jgi:hypothetical protein